MTALAAAELVEERAELLPQRDTMLLDFNIAPVIAVNLAIAVNAATIGSSATAVAWQNLGVLQH